MRLGSPLEAARKNDFESGPTSIRVARLTLSESPKSQPNISDCEADEDAKLKAYRRWVRGCRVGVLRIRR